MERTNEAALDRLLRIVIGALILALGWAGAMPGWWAPACKLFGLYPLITGVLGWDPVYALVGFRTTAGQR